MLVNERERDWNKIEKEKEVEKEFEIKSVYSTIITYIIFYNNYLTLSISNIWMIFGGFGGRGGGAGVTILKK